MRISSKDIGTFIKCPRLLTFKQSAIPIPTDKKLAIARKIIYKCYTTALETKHLVDWKRILGWVDSMIFKDMDISNTEAYTAARIISEQILLFLQSWYHAIYILEGSFGYCQIPFEAVVGRNVIYTKIPVIKPTEPLVIMYIDDKTSEDVKMYNNIESRIWAWLLSKTIESNDIMLQHITIKPKGGFEIEHSMVDKEANERVEKVVAQAAEAMRWGIDYPSVNEQCKYCAFQGRCRV